MPERDLRERFLWVVRAMVVGAGFALAVGLLLHVTGTNARMADESVRVGLVVLMATPVVRVLIAIAERLRRPDLLYVTVTAIVLLELTVTMWYAMTRV